MGRKQKKVLFNLLFFYHLVTVSGDDIFSVVGPTTLRIDEPYDVAVTSHRLNATNEPIRVGIEGLSFKGENYSVYQDVIVPSGETTIVTLLVRFYFLSLTFH